MLGDKIRYFEYKHRYDISKDFRFVGRAIVFYGDGKITIGEGSYINGYCQVQANDPDEVRIGKNCGIGPFTLIYTGTREADQNMSLKPWALNRGNVVIKDSCWIGAHVFINPGITVGENVVIGANSVVTHDIPDYAIAAGSPARVIRFKKCKDSGE